MPTTIPENVTEFEDAQTARWLEDKLRPARARIKDGPSVDAVARMRARIFGEEAPQKKDRRIAA
jgi:hypothetical protein